MNAGGRAIRLALRGVPVAVLTERRRSEGGASYELQFERDYVEALERPIFSLACFGWRLDQGHRFRGRLPAFLRNLLPDPDGGLRRRLALSLGLDPTDEMGLLAVLGGDMSGAITATPLAAEASAEPRRRFVDVDAPPTSSDVRPLRFSLGGVQLKFSVDRADRVSVPVDGRGGRWILKIPDASRPELPRAELAAMLWARATGFEVPAVEIVDPREVVGLPPDAIAGVESALLVRRFDRTDAHEPVHMEELAQVLSVDPEDKYCDEHCRHRYNLVAVARLVRRFAGPEALRTLVARIVFDVLVGNGDAHLKNWAFLYRDPRTPTLAPAYDIVPTVLFGYPPDLALAFTSERAMRAFDAGRLRQFASKVGEPPDEILAVARQTVARALDTFDAAMDAAGLSADARRRLQSHLSALPLGRSLVE